MVVNGRPKDDSEDDNGAKPPSLQKDESALLMEKIVAARIEGHEDADQKLAEELHRQQLEERIQELKAQLQQQKRQKQQQQQNQRQGAAAATSSEKVFFGGQNNNGRRSTAASFNNSADEAEEDNVEETPASEQESSSMQFIEKIVEQRVLQQSHEDQTPLERLASLKQQLGQDSGQPLVNTTTTTTTSSPPPVRQFPGAVRVRGIHAGQAGLSSQSIIIGDEDLVIDNENDLADNDDVEQAGIPQQQRASSFSPEQAMCFVMNSNTEEEPIESDEKRYDDRDTYNNDDNKRESSDTYSTMGMTLIGAGLFMLVVCMLVIIILVLRNATGDGDPTTAPPPTTVPPTSSPTVPTHCPCSFEAGGQPITACGRFLDLEEILQTNQVGLGICKGAGCAFVIPQSPVDLDKHACFIVFKSQSGNLETMFPPQIIHTDAQLASCENILSIRCP